MTFARCSKFALLPLLVGAFALALTGCGSSSNLALSQGNWSMTATQTGGGVTPNSTFYIGGNLTQNGTSLAGTMSIANSLCYSSSQTVTFTGTVKGNNVTLTSSSVGGEVITVIATGTAGSLTGNYAISGGNTCDGDTGTIAANPVPAITASWSGPYDPEGDPNAVLTVAITQATSASSDGTFALTGNLTFANSSCSVSGSLTSAFIAGPYLVVNGSTVESDGSAGDFTYTQVFLNNSGTPTSMTGTYSVSDGLCSGDYNTATFTKQQ
jgi:hypothetical protein